MKMTVRITETAAGRFVALCDEQGELLPCQRAATLHTEVNDHPRLTVEFVVDGESLRLVESA